MSQPHAKYLVVIFFAFWGVNVFAQTNSVSNPTNGRENDPYSKYGIGELVNGSNASLRGMANITSAYENPYEVNSENPASYSYLQRTTFEAAFTASTRSINANGLSYNTGTASISYVNIGIPINKNAGMCLGFKPIAHTYYSLVDTLTTATGSPIGNAARSYNGEGSINYAYLGGAYRFHEVSVGFNLGYMFGTIQNNTAVVPIDIFGINRAFTAEYNNFTRIGGLYWKAGLMYEHKIDSDYSFRIGGTFAMSQNLNEQLSSYQVSVYNFGDTIVNDTTSNSGVSHGKLTMPYTYSIGVMFTKTDKWSMGLDYTTTKWSQFNSNPDVSRNVGIANSAYKIAFGGEYTPDINSIRNYFSHVTYKYGVYYGTDYLNLVNTTIPYYGLTVGASLPFRRNTSKLHAALDIGRLGNTANSQVQETYVRFTLGFSFNDRWFIPRKYD